MKYLEFYKERIADLPTPKDSGECVVKCLFHSDNTPSLAVNVISGKWKCYTPSCPAHAGGGHAKFDAFLRGEQLGTNVIPPPSIDAQAIDGFHAILKSGVGDALKVLTDKRGLTTATIERFKLGFDGDRILIPIYAADGSCLNIRKYKYGAKVDKVIQWSVRHSQARLYPLQSLESDWVLLCEGELDCILACQLGFPAITSTGGADGWSKEFNKQFVGKKVVIAFDADDAGVKGAESTAHKLLPYAAAVCILKWPLAGTKEEKDLTDYIVKLRHSAEELQALIDSAEAILPIVEKQDTPDTTVTEVHLSQIGDKAYVNKRVKSTILVAGKDLAPFQVPKRIDFRCRDVGSDKNLCKNCGLCDNGGKLEVNVPEWSLDLLQMVNVPLERRDSILFKMAGVPERCQKPTHEVKDFVNVEAIKAIPEIDFAAEQSNYVIRGLYYLGHGIETNRTFAIEAVVLPDPKTQYATALIYSASASRDSVEQLNLTHEQLAALSIFTVKET